MNFAIIGCGLMGQRRVRSLEGDHRLVMAVDSELNRAQKIAGQISGAISSTNWREAIKHPEVEAVMVCTTNDHLSSITMAAILAGKHVLVEKPAGRSPKELCSILEEADRRGILVQVGFNHRFHPAIQQARRIVEAGDLGPLMFVRGRYGHGGRIGYDREWRSNPDCAGGGELMDQGVHLIDLSRWFLGDFTRVEGWAHTFFWNMTVEDNGFLLLRTAENKAAWLHASCTEWKNLFSFEIYGRHGKLHIEGLGRSYGVEKLTHYRMRPEMGPPEIQVWEYPGEDPSWRAELQVFAHAIQTRTRPLVTLRDAIAALEIVQSVYQRTAL